MGAFVGVDAGVAEDEEGCGCLLRRGWDGVCIREYVELSAQSTDQARKIIGTTSMAGFAAESPIVGGQTNLPHIR